MTEPTCLACGRTQAQVIAAAPREPHMSMRHGKCEDCSSVGDARTCTLPDCPQCSAPRVETQAEHAARTEPNPYQTYCANCGYRIPNNQGTYCSATCADEGSALGRDEF